MPNFSIPDEVFERAADTFQTPLHVYDEKGIRLACRALNEAFSWCEGFKEYFAVKALPNPAILRIMREENVGVDCSSLTELMLARASGFSGEEIMFSANEMPPEEFTYARALGAYINLDDLTHVDILEQNGGVPDCVCLRYNPGGDFLIGTHVMGNPGDAKYGMTRPQLTQALLRLKALGASSFGLHAFLSSNTQNPDYYPTLAKLLFHTAKELGAETGMRIAFVNLSGGVGIPYGPKEAPVNIKAVGEGVQEAYESVFTQNSIRGVRIFTELGRWMTGPYGFLLTRAVHEKRIYKHYIGVDASACDLLRPAMYGAYHHIHACGKRGVPETALYDIVGALCENNDKFAIDRRMPALRMGDLLVIHDTGAHGYAMGYNYNGRLRSKEVLLKEDGDLKLIRRGETPRDYFATLEVDEGFSALQADPYFND